MKLPVVGHGPERHVGIPVRADVGDVHCHDASALVVRHRERVEVDVVCRLQAPLELPPYLERGGALAVVVGFDPPSLE